MEKELSFKIAGVFSIISMVMLIIPGNIVNSEVFQFLFMAFLPYILLKLRDYTSLKYEFKNTGLFNTLILVQILYLIVFILISEVFKLPDMEYRYAAVIMYSVSIVSILKGLLFFATGMQLTRSFSRFNANLKTLSVCFIIIGLALALLSSWLFLDKAFTPNNYTVIIVNLVNRILQIIQIVMYGVIAYTLLADKKSIELS